MFLPLQAAAACCCGESPLGSAPLSTDEWFISHVVNEMLCLHTRPTNMFDDSELRQISHVFQQIIVSIPRPWCEGVMSGPRHLHTRQERASWEYAPKNVTRGVTHPVACPEFPPLPASRRRTTLCILTPAQSVQKPRYWNTLSKNPQTTQKWFVSLIIGSLNTMGGCCLLLLLLFLTGLVADLSRKCKSSHFLYSHSETFTITCFLWTSGSPQSLKLVIRRRLTWLEGFVVTPAHPLTCLQN